MLLQIGSSILTPVVLPHAVISKWLQLHPTALLGLPEAFVGIGPQWISSILTWLFCLHGTGVLYQAFQPDTELRIQWSPYESHPPPTLLVLLSPHSSPSPECLPPPQGLHCHLELLLGSGWCLASIDSSQSAINVFYGIFMTPSTGFGA